jgi:hypothetical protein
MDKKRILIPVVVFLVFTALYASISLIRGNDFLFRPVWDIGHYLTIADRGYEVFPCDPKIHYPMGKICGNVGWFPAWPLAMKIFSLGQTAYGVRFLPYLFGLLGFVFFYNLLLRWADSKAALLGIIALAATPTGFYYLTGFPYSFILVLLIAYLYYLYEPKAPGRLYILPFLGILISLSYPSAFLTAIIPFVMVINNYRLKAKWPGVFKLIKDLLYYLVPFALGPFLLSLYFYFKFDDFLLILHFQEKYERNWDFPLAVIWQSMKYFQFSTNAHFMQIEHTYFAANFIILWYGLIFFIFAPYRTKPELVAYVLLLYLFSPATGTVFSIWRHYVLLIPAVMMIALSARPQWVKIVYIALGLFLALYIYFPEYIRSYLV